MANLLKMDHSLTKFSFACLKKLRLLSASQLHTSREMMPTDLLSAFPCLWSKLVFIEEITNGYRLVWKFECGEKKFTRCELQYLQSSRGSTGAVIWGSPMNDDRL